VKTEESSVGENLPGINWSENSQSWITAWTESGVARQFSFSVAALGEKEALRLALEARRKIQTANFTGIAPDASATSASPAPPAKERDNAKKQSGVTGVSWDETQKRWHAQWYERGKKSNKYFSVAEFGDAEALRLAIQWRQEKERTGKASVVGAATRQSGHVGVTWCETGQRWQASVQRGGKRISKPFSIKTHGDAGALRLAVAWRQENKIQ